MKEDSSDGRELFRDHCFSHGQNRDHDGAYQNMGSNSEQSIPNRRETQKRAGAIRGAGARRAFAYTRTIR